MITLLAWYFYCEVILDCLYEFNIALLDVSSEACFAFEVGFDAEHRRLFPDFYLD